jgi:hypothetical protein
MNPLIQLNRQLQHLFIALLFACFAIAQSAQAVSPEPNEGDLIGNMAEEDSALLDLSTDAESAAMAQAAKDPTPNHREITIKWLPIPIVLCAFGSEEVDLRGLLKLAFRAQEDRGARTVRPVHIELQRGSAVLARAPNRAPKRRVWLVLAKKLVVGMWQLKWRSRILARPPR